MVFEFGSVYFIVSFWEDFLSFVLMTFLRLNMRRKFKFYLREVWGFFI